MRPNSTRRWGERDTSAVGLTLAVPPGSPSARDMAIGNAASWEPSGPRRCAFRAPDWRPPRAKRANGGTRRSPLDLRRTKRADALIAGAYLSGTNTRRVRRALAALFGGAVGKDTVSRVWRKTKGDWDAWNARALKEEPIVRLILDGTVVRVRLDKKATSISLLVALGVRADGQKVLLAIKNMGGESEAAWRALLDNLVARGLRTPELVIVDGGSGLDKALAALWPEAPVQRCTVHYADLRIMPTSVVKPRWKATVRVKDAA